MNDAKAFVESIARNYGSRGGHRGIRSKYHFKRQQKLVGSGIKGFDSMYTFAEKLSPMGNPSADECADYCGYVFRSNPKSDNAKSFSRWCFVTNGISEEMMTLAKIYANEEE